MPLFNPSTGGSVSPGSITNTEVSASAAIAATKIHDGSVDNTEFGYLNGVTSSIQTQFNSLNVNLRMKPSVFAAQTSFDTYMMATYNNGTAGVGATITSAMNEVFAIDNETPSVGERVLITNQASTFQNGIYTVTDAGSVATPWILTRATNYDASSEISALDVIPVERGSVYGGTFWQQTGTVNTIGTDGFVFENLAPSNPFLRTTNNLNDLTNASLALANLGGGSPIGSGTIILGVTASFTPTVTLVGGAGNTVPVYSTNSANATQLGNRMFVDVYLTGDGGDEGAGTGVINIELPDTANASQLSGVFPCGYALNNATAYPLYGEIAGSANTISLSYITLLGAVANFTGADQNNATRTIRLHFSYLLS
jgi:hypothetical protein